ncbi:MAG: RNA 2',3'-cyclic phosphodiesterase [Chloroflexi bacterium]|nr:MAG: RNA 2',3'-cyclic phosphodiesterase [Chloroflexota bacterium]
MRGNRQVPSHITTVRAFFGLPLPDEHRAQLAAFLAQSGAAAPQFRWVSAPNLHLTLRFIGTIERELIGSIADRLADSRLSSFELGLGELGTFKRGRLVRVAWLGLTDGVEAAKELAGRIEAECARAGLEAEQRPFQPHLTLARARNRFGGVLPPLPPAPRLESWRADELVLYESRLSPKGSIYQPLRVLALE